MKNDEYQMSDFSQDDDEMDNLVQGGTELQQNQNGEKENNQTNI